MSKAVARRVVVGAALLVGVSIVGANVLLQNAEEEALRETIRTYFSAKTPDAEREAAWNELVETGVADFEFLIYGLEQTNALFMFDEGVFEKLVQAVETHAGTPTGIVQGCRNALAGEMSAGKVCALDILVRYGQGEVAGEVASVLNYVEELEFVRRAAALTLGELGAVDYGQDLLLIASSPEEHVLLREACLEALWMLGDAGAETTSSTLLFDPGTPWPLVARCVSCLIEQGRSGPLVDGLLTADLEFARRAVCAKGLARIGGTTEVAAISDVLSASPEPEILDAVLDGAADSRTGGLEDVAREALTSGSKATRLRAMRAIVRVKGESLTAADVDELYSAVGSSEEQHFLDRSVK